MAANPYDSESKSFTYDTGQMRTAFALGGCAGLLLSRVAYEPYILHPSFVLSQGVHIAHPHPSLPESTRAKMYARSLFELGSRGLEMAGQQVEQWLGEQASIAAPSAHVEHAYLTSAGISIVLTGQAFRAAKQRDFSRGREELTRAVATFHDVDWDERFREELAQT